jgi:histidinol phosphatase-like PHP family hydrolase
MPQCKPIPQLAGKTISRASIEQANDLYMLELGFTDHTTFSLELWPQAPKLKLNMLPAEDGAKPERIKL